MNHGIFSSTRRHAAWLLITLGTACAGTAFAQDKASELRVLTHSSFALPKPLLAQFEKEAGVKLRISKAGDAGGACPLFAGKQVASKGWCSAYAKKA